jgi:hypothetical protein
MKNLKNVYLFPNGMVVAFDPTGKQIPELQGKDSPELREKLKEAALPDCSWNGFGPEGTCKVVVKVGGEVLGEVYPGVLAPTEFSYTQKDWTEIDWPEEVMQDANFIQGPIADVVIVDDPSGPKSASEVLAGIKWEVFEAQDPWTIWMKTRPITDEQARLLDFLFFGNNSPLIDIFEPPQDETEGFHCIRSQWSTSLFLKLDDATDKFLEEIDLEGLSATEYFAKYPDKLFKKRS